MKKSILFLISLTLLSVASSSTLSNLARFWIVTCNTNSCEKAFQNAIDNKCSGLKQCKAVIDQHYPYCSMCLQELVDKDILEEINGQEYLVCSSEEQVQSLGCELYCRVNWYVTGQCGRLGNMPVCECSNSDFTVSTTSASTTTTSPTTTSNTTTASSTTSSSTASPAKGNWTLKHTLTAHTGPCWIVCSPSKRWSS